MARRAVLFDLGGVLFGPGLQHFLGSCEREWGLPRNFLWDVLLSGGSQSSYSRALRGQITLSQLFSEVDEGCRRRASSLGIAIPGAFSAARPFQDLQAQGSVDVRMLRVAGILRWNGFKTCALTNNWVDDSDGRSAAAALLERLRRHFDLVLESCRIGMCQPDPGIYSYALEALQAQPQEAILLDDQAENLAAARDLGMATILVRDPDSALRELQELSGVQLLGQEEPLPIPCDPAGVTHGYVSIRPGVRLHFVELGQGPVLCLCHGFPESWLSWRFQIPALADAGFRVIALEMKGYGESTAPADIPEYSQERICEGIPQVVLVGHDWGGAVAWNVALFYPERLRAVASLNTPYRPADPGVDIMEKLGSSPAFDYQLYFQEPGVAEAELEKDVGRTLKILIRSSRVELRPLPAGGLLVGFPENPPGSRLLPPAELEYYSQQFRKSGFRGPLNWYRNMRANWSWALSARDRKIPIPALMVTAGKDPVLHPGLSKGMESWVSLGKPGIREKSRNSGGVREESGNFGGIWKKSGNFWGMLEGGRGRGSAIPTGGVGVEGKVGNSMEKWGKSGNFSSQKRGGKNWEFPGKVGKSGNFCSRKRGGKIGNSIEKWGKFGNFSSQKRGGNGRKSREFHGKVRKIWEFQFPQECRE
uniref:AB hydrolase-1 domain-containing protein n=1 Tax=Corvus moneduloides TaxID=1196302 RepID=A0A8U7MNS1_CORMO